MNYKSDGIWESVGKEGECIQVSLCHVWCDGSLV